MDLAMPQVFPIQSNWGNPVRRRLPIVATIFAALCFPAIAEEPAAPPHGFHNGDWPFRPPQRPAPPAVADPSFAANPIDNFILARLEAAGLRMASPADKLTLLRRVSFDLV